MEEFDIFRDIAERTDGDIYIGVVGPVRAGKSTFIKRFMDLLVLPNIDDEFERQRTIDELPQSGAGKTVMTTEPKFVPDDGVAVTLNDMLTVRVRLVDSVGFPVEGALGYTEDDGPRMVNTPWFDEAIPFEEAAIVGTRKVIAEHSTLGLVVTTDGSFGEIPRESYVAAENQAIGELREIGKPFLIVLNSAQPEDETTRALAASLEQEHGVTVVPANCARLDEAGLVGMLEQVLYEFPVQEIDVALPGWVQELPGDHWLRGNLDGQINQILPTIERVRDVEPAAAALADGQYVESSEVSLLDLGTGAAAIQVKVPEQLFYEVLEEIAGVSLEDQAALMRFMREASEARVQFAKARGAWKEATEVGYGTVVPDLGDMIFEEPEMVRKGNQFGVRLRATAPAFHIIRTDVEAEYTPLLGTEQQSEDLVRYLLEKFEDDPKKIWDSNILGKSLSELLQEGVEGKIHKMPDNARIKMQETLQRIVNEGSGGLICIIL